MWQRREFYFHLYFPSDLALGIVFLLFFFFLFGHPSDKYLELNGSGVGTWLDSLACFWPNKLNVFCALQQQPVAIGRIMPGRSVRLDVTSCSSHLSHPSFSHFSFSLLAFFNFLCVCISGSGHCEIFWVVYVIFKDLR